MSAPVHVVMQRAAELAASRRAPRRSVLRLVPPAAEPAPEPLQATRPTCVYCGRSTTGRAVACHAHADLPKIDPVYSPDVPQKKEPVERSHPGSAARPALTKGR